MPDRNVSLHLAPLSLPGLGIRRVGHQLKTPPLPTSELVQEPGVVRRLRRKRIPPGLLHQNRARRPLWAHHIKHVLVLARGHAPQHPGARFIQLGRNSSPHRGVHSLRVAPQLSPFPPVRVKPTLRECRHARITVSKYTSPVATFSSPSGLSSSSSSARTTSRRPYFRCSGLKDTGTSWRGTEPPSPELASR